MMFHRAVGDLLIEILITISVAALILVLVSQTSFVSLRADQSAREQNTAISLAEQMVETVDSAVLTRWRRLSTELSKGSSNIYTTATDTANAWTVTTGSQAIAIDTVTYTTGFYAENVCRSSTSTLTGITDTAGTATTCVNSGGSYDPSTIKITATVSWSGGSVTRSQYISRWRNKVCTQTNWNGGVESGTSTCPTTGYGSMTNMDVTTSGTISVP